MIAIICAMQVECEAILRHCSDVIKKEKFHHVFYEAKLAQQPVVIGLCGVAKVNAAITTTLLCTEYPIDVILNIGVAGGLKENENVKDLVISTSVVQHDYDTSALDGEEGKGLFVEVEERLVALAEKVLNQLQVPYHKGCIASGDLFVTKKHLNQLLTDYPQAICAEMEAGAIAQTAHSFQVPFIILRSLSDVAVKENSAIDFCTYVQEASVISAAFAVKFVEGLSSWNN